MPASLPEELIDAVYSVVLEPAAQELVESTAKHPFLFELGPELRFP